MLGISTLGSVWAGSAGLEPRATWANGAELDLLVIRDNRRLAFELESRLRPRA
ncbi:MAG: hypothetical protein GY719_31935 [bacterium]|nr:hypothetical protein [bacterium]